MNITEEQSAAMLEAAKPLMEWINDNCHPHCAVTVDHVRVELQEGVVVCRTEEFLRD